MERAVLSVFLDPDENSIPAKYNAPDCLCR